MSVHNKPKRNKKQVAKKVAKVSFCCTLIPILLIPVISTALIYFFPHHLQYVFFQNFRRIPLTDYENVTANDVKSIGRSFYLQGEEGKIGVWHILPTSLSNEYKKAGIQPTEEEIEALIAKGTNPIVMYAHGNSFDRTINHRCMLYNVLTDLDYHVIAFDYRGYGDSEGSPTEPGITADARSVYEYVRTVAGNNTVIIWGHSMGTGVSARLVRDLSLDGIPPDGLVLESAFNNLHDVVLNHPFSLPFRYLPEWIIEKFILERFRSVGLTMDSDQRIKLITCPILVAHADDDHVIPSLLARKLVAAAKTTSRDVEYVEFEATRLFAHKFIYLAEELPGLVKKFIAYCEAKKNVTEIA